MGMFENRPKNDYTGILILVLLMLLMTPLTAAQSKNPWPGVALIAALLASGIGAGYLIATYL